MMTICSPAPTDFGIYFRRPSQLHSSSTGRIHRDYGKAPFNDKTTGLMKSTSTHQMQSVRRTVALLITANGIAMSENYILFNIYK